MSIAQALAAEPRLLVCDELDMMTQAQAVAHLAALQERLRPAMLFISQDLGVIQPMSHCIAVMEDGRVVETGTADETFDTPGHLNACLAWFPSARKLKEPDAAGVSRYKCGYGVMVVRDGRTSSLYNKSGALII